jgi:hypothetical protein
MTGDIRRANASARHMGPRRFARGAATALTLLALAACTSGDVMELRPEIDVGTQTSAMSMPDLEPAQPAEAMESDQPIPQVDPVFPEEQAFPEDQAFPEEPAFPEEQSFPEGPAMSAEPAEPSDPAPPAGRLPSVEPSQALEPRLAGYPRMDEPVETMMPMTADERTCRRQLKKLGVTFQELDPIRDSAACYIDHPVKVSRIGRVNIKPAATLNCEMAEALAAWTRNELVPASRWRFFSGVKTIHQGSSYSCRNIAGTRGTPSEHSRGNAIDIMKIELQNGKMIDVRKPGLFAFRKRGLLNTVRADGCEYFTTVLGPGYNADHADHFHFDIKSRRNGHRACR